jgi:hypothetical protein
MNLNKIFVLAAQFKVYFSTASFYLSFINFVLILATFKLTYGIDISAFILIPLGFIFVLFIGFLDYRLILSHQSKYVNRKNDLKTQLDRIEEKLDRIEDKMNE